jgi:hypothetical protein
MYIASLLYIVYFVNGCLRFMHKYFKKKLKKNEAAPRKEEKPTCMR